MERNIIVKFLLDVVSDKMDNTITVVVLKQNNHLVYGININYSK